MSQKRIKLSAPTIRTRAEAEQVVGDIRLATIERDRRKLDIEQAKKVIDDAHAEVIADLTRKIELCCEGLRTWAEGNPAEFGARKSLELTHGTIGWRLGNPTLKTLAGRTWDMVLAAAREVAPRFVRKKEEVDKQSLLAERETVGPDMLRLLGVRVSQDEPFFVDPKIDEVEKRVTTV